LARLLAPFQPLLPDQTLAVLILSNFLLSVGYGIILEWFWRGQTLGKRIFQLRVMDENGFPLRFHQVLIRNIMRFVDSLPLYYLVGGVACVTSRYGKRLGDHVAGTVVARVASSMTIDVDEVSRHKYNSFRQHPHICARLRQRVRPEMASLMLEALFRCNDFLPDARLSLFRELADFLRNLVPFPETAVLGLTDEQYVRNAVEVIFESAKRQPEPLGKVGASQEA